MDTPGDTEPSRVASGQRKVPPDTPPEQILWDWFESAWSDLTRREQGLVVSELRRYFAGEFQGPSRVEPAEPGVYATPGGRSFLRQLLGLDPGKRTRAAVEAVKRRDRELGLRPE